MHDVSLNCLVSGSGRQGVALLTHKGIIIVRVYDNCGKRFTLVPTEARARIKKA